MIATSILLYKAKESAASKRGTRKVSYAETHSDSDFDTQSDTDSDVEPENEPDPDPEPEPECTEDEYIYSFDHSSYSSDVHLHIFEHDDQYYIFKNMADFIIKGDLNSQCINFWLNEGNVVLKKNSVVTLQLSDTKVEKAQESMNKKNERIQKQKGRNADKNTYVNGYIQLPKHEYAMVKQAYISTVMPLSNSTNFNNIREFSLIEIGKAFEFMGDKLQLLFDSDKLRDWKIDRMNVKHTLEKLYMDQTMCEYIGKEKLQRMIQKASQKRLHIHSSSSEPVPVPRAPEHPKVQTTYKQRKEMELEKIRNTLNDSEYWNINSYSPFMHNIISSNEYESHHCNTTIRPLKKLSELKTKVSLSNENKMILDNYNESRIMNAINTSIPGRTNVDETTQHNSYLNILRYLYFMKKTLGLNWSKYSFEEILISDAEPVNYGFITTAFSWYVKSYCKYEKKTSSTIIGHIRAFAQHIKDMDVPMDQDEALGRAQQQHQSLSRTHEKKVPDKLDFATDVQMVAHNCIKTTNAILENESTPTDQKWEAAQQQLCAHFLCFYPPMRGNTIQKLCVHHSSNLEDYPPTLLLTDRGKWIIDHTHPMQNINARAKTSKQGEEKTDNNARFTLHDCTSQLLDYVCEHFDEYLKKHNGYIFGGNSHTTKKIGKKVYKLPNPRKLFEKVVNSYTPSKFFLNGKRGFKLHDFRKFFNTFREHIHKNSEYQNILKEIEKSAQRTMQHGRRMQQIDYNMDGEFSELSIVFAKGFVDAFDPQKYSCKTVGVLNAHCDADIESSSEADSEADSEVEYKETPVPIYTPRKKQRVEPTKAHDQCTGREANTMTDYKDFPDGWKYDLRQTPSGRKYPLFFSPSGKRFESAKKAREHIKASS